MERAAEPGTTYWLGVGAGRDALLAGALTCETWVRALLARIARHEPQVRAWAWLDADQALAQAWQADATASEARDALHGVPVGIKDVIDVAGMPGERGSAAFAGRVPTRSASLVERLRAAGAIVLGKTVTAELAFLVPGPTRNPWGLAHTPGGSSSGSAAAVAAGFVPAAIGTQTNGSVIRPAAYCGVVGFKPSWGTIPLDGVQPFSPTLDHAGVFARSVADAAQLARCLAEVPPEWGECAAPPRLALVRTPVWSRAEPAQQAQLLALAARLRAAGAELTERELPQAFDAAHAVHRIIMAAEGARSLAALRRDAQGDFSGAAAALMAEGAAIDDAALRAAHARRAELAAEFSDWITGFDAVLTPPATGEAPPTLEHTGDPAFCTIWTLIGVPAMTLPCGFGPHGLPLGVQLVSGRNTDGPLLAVAQWCERVIGLAPLFAPLSD